MKQKKINDILYVFDITPYIITNDTDADVIKVQEECYAGYVELNPTLADKIVKYNYHMITVTQQEWAPYVDHDGPVLEITGTNIHSHSNIEFDGVEQTNQQYYYNVAPGTVIDIYPTDTTSDYELISGATWDTDHWTATMGDTDLTITINYSSSPVLVGHTLTLQGNSIYSYVTVEFDGVQQEVVSEYQNVIEGTLVTITPTEDPSYYTLIEGAEWDTDHWVYEMGSTDWTIEINYKQSPELEWSSATATVTIGSSGNTFPTLSNPHNVNVTYNSTIDNVATIDSSGNITLLTAGNTSIWAMFDGDETYEAQVATYELTVEAAQPSADKTLVVPKINNANPFEYVIFDTVDGDFIDSLPYYSCTDEGSSYNIMLIGEREYEINESGSLTYSVELYYDDQYTTPVQTTQGTLGQEFEFASSDTVMYAKLTPAQASPTVRVQYYVDNDTEPVEIFNWPDSSYDSNVPDQMFVDGVEETVSNTYQFDSTGTHTIEYVFNDGCFDIGLNDIGGETSYNIYVTDVTVGENITSVADYAWGIKAGYEPGASEALSLPLTYLPIVPPTINSTGASDLEAPGDTVYVPADSVTDYQQASVWSDIAQLIQAIVPA